MFIPCPPNWPFSCEPLYWISSRVVPFLLTHFSRSTFSLDAGLSPLSRFPPCSPRDVVLSLLFWNRFCFPLRSFNQGVNCAPVVPAPTPVSLLSRGPFLSLTCSNMISVARLFVISLPSPYVFEFSQSRFFHSFFLAVPPNARCLVPFLARSGCFGLMVPIRFLYFGFVNLRQCGWPFAPMSTRARAVPSPCPL